MASTRSRAPSTRSRQPKHPAKQDVPEFIVPDPEIPYLQAEKKTRKRKVTKEVDDDYSPEEQEPRITQTKKQGKILTRHSERDTAIRRKCQKVIPDPDLDSEGELYFEFTPADSSAQLDTSDSTLSIPMGWSASDYATGSPNSWDSDNEPQNQFEDPEFVLLRTVDDRLLHLPDSHLSLVKKIVGVQQIFPEHDSLIHSLKVSEKQFSLDKIANKNLQARIANNSSFKEAALAFKDYFCAMTWKSTGWIRSEDSVSELELEDTMLNMQVQWIRRGFLGGMKNGTGKNSFGAVFKLCEQFILADLGISRVMHEIYGNNAEESSQVHYQEYHFWKMVDGELCRPTNKQLTVGLQKTTEWTSEPIVSKTNCDLAVFVKLNKIGNKYGIPVILESMVKSHNEAMESLDKCILQTWLQALAGLKTRDVSYGILYEPMAIYILELRKGKREGKSTRSRSLITSVRSFTLISEDTFAFDVSEFTNFVHHLCCILAAASGQA